MKNYKNVIASTKWLKRVILSYTKLDNLLSKLSYALWVGTKWSLFDHLATCCLSGHDPRMGRRISTCLLGGTIIMFCITACDDSSSGAGPDPVAEVSSSSGTIRHCEEQTEGCDEAISSSENASSGGSSVSSGKENSSSSAKSSSSTDSKSSSSVTSSSSGTSAGSSAGGSSSSLKTCPPEKEGNTRTVMETGEKQLCKDGYWVPMESSSSSKVSSSSYFDMTNQFNEKVSYGEFTDPRDGHKYRTVSMYDDTFERTYVFFAENLNYGKMVSGGTVQGDSTKYCYDDDPWYCENGWGGLYTWSNAMNFPAECDSVAMNAEACSQKFVYPSEYAQPQNYVQHQGICPEGWHIVNAGEWAHLDQRTGGSVTLYMGSKVAGCGRDDLYGMSLLPAGYWERTPNGALHFYNIEMQTNFWMAKQYSDDGKKALGVWIASSGIHRDSPALKSSSGFSSRCVKNY